MSALRTRLVLAMDARSWPTCTSKELVDAVLAVLAAPADADVERVARAIDPVGWKWCDHVLDHLAQALFVGRQMRDARAAIRALVGEPPA